MNIDLALNLLRGIRDRNTFTDPGFVLNLDDQIAYISKLNTTVPAQPDICRQVLEDECVVSWIAADLTNQDGVKKAINDLCLFAVQIATDPATNGGRTLQPAQPSAVPEAVAKDAEREVRIKLMVATELLKRAEPFTLCSHSDLNREIYVFLNHAILSAADTEVKK